MSLARDITTVGGGTLMSRLLGFVRDAGIAALLGTGPFSEAFFAVLQVINFFRRLLAEGALNSAFVPIWLSLRSGEEGENSANRFTRRALFAIGGMTGLITLLAVIFAPYVIVTVAPGFDEGLRGLASFYLWVTAPYIVLTGLIAVVAAALNAESRVVAVTISTVAFNLVMVAAVAFIFETHTHESEIGLVLAGTIVVAGVVQLLITSLVWLATGRRWPPVSVRPTYQTRRFFARAVPGLIAAGIPQLKLIAAAAIVSSSQAAISWLYYANRLYELPLGVASIVIAAVIVPRVAASVHSGDSSAYAAAQSRAFEIALGVALPAATGFALLAPHIAGGLFEHGEFGARDTEAVAVVLIAACSGLPGHVLEKVFGAVSFAHADTRTPMLAALTGLTTAIVVGVVLFKAFGYIGMAAAIAVSGWVGAGLLGIVLYRRHWLRLDGIAARRLPRIAIATALMGLALSVGIFIADWLVPTSPVSAIGRLAVLGALVTLGMLVYGLAIERLGVAKIGQLIAAVREGS